MNDSNIIIKISTNLLYRTALDINRVILPDSDNPLFAFSSLSEVRKSASR